MHIREERPEDQFQVLNLIRETFWNLFQPGCDQHLIVQKIKEKPWFIKELTLVVQENKKIVGHIIYYKTSVEYQNGDILETITFGPLSVDPQKQSLGIGSLLVKTSLAKAKQLGFKGVIIQGHPYYYPRFGFKRGKHFNIRDQDGQYYLGTMALQLQKDYFLKDKECKFNSFFPKLDQKQIDILQSRFPNKKQKFRTRSQQIFQLLVTKKWNEDVEVSVWQSYCREKINQN